MLGRRIAAAAGAAALLIPALACAHERWIKHDCKPFNRAYFQSMTGEVLEYSLAATMAIAAIVASWYLIAVPLVGWLTPTTDDERARAARRPLPVRLARGLLLFFLDGENDSRWMDFGERATAWFFSKIPAGVLALGVYQRWLVMPSYPLTGQTGEILRIVEALLAVWVASGFAQRWLGGVLFLVWGYLCYAYGIAGIDAIPVLASAFFYYYATPGGLVNSRQLAGVRLSLGIGFFLLGLVNKMYIAELFIGVGDNYPQLIEASRHLIPGLTREAWSFTTALGEMTFGLLLLLGLYDKLATLALSLIFTNFIFTFGRAEIVHIYPIAGFLLLFFHAPPGTVLDGAVFRAHVGIWRGFGRRGNRVNFPIASLLVAGAAALLLMLGPLFVVVHVLPRIGR